MSTILLVDDEEIFRETLSEFLSFENYKIICAKDGQEALNLIECTAFDLILTDIQMPLMSGVELLEKLSEQKIKIPVVLMTGYTNLLETKNAYEIGASEFISKPFKCDELMMIVKKLLPSASSIELHNEVTRTDRCVYVEIPVWSIIGKESIPIDIFIKLSATKFLKIIKSGQTIDVARLSQYQKRGLCSLYIREEDAVVLSKKMEEESVEEILSRRNDFINSIIRQVQDFSVIKKLKKEQSDKLKSNLDLVIGKIYDNSGLKNLYDMIEKISVEMNQHSISAMTYSILLAGETGDEYTEEDISCLGLAGMFHDIGETKLDKELLAKGLSKMSLDEKSKFEEHVFTSWLMLENVPDINPLILRIISEHHEHQDGTGFPQGLSQDQIHPLSKILGMASKFSKLINQSHSHLIVSDINALNILYKKHKGHFPENLIQIFEKIVITQEVDLEKKDSEKIISSGSSNDIHLNINSEQFKQKIPLTKIVS